MATPVIDLSGTPYERGVQHGEATKPLVETGMARWRASLLGVAEGDVGAYLARFIAQTDFLAAIREATPELLEEVDGIADGANVDRTTALAYQFMDEQWCFEHRRSMAITDAHHCSGVSIRRSGGGRIVAQNMDLPSNFDTTQVVLRVAGDDGPNLLLFTAAGLIVTTGMNAAKVGVCVNSIMDRPTAASGLPVAFAIRGALQRETAKEAAEFLRSVPHASGQNYLISDPDEVFDLEAAADGVLEYAPGETVVHTNHSLALDEDAEALETYAERHRMDLSGLQNSHARHHVILRALGDRADATEGDISTALSDLTAPVCRIPTPTSAWMTFGSVIMTLHDVPQMQLAPGPPSEVAYETHRFS